MPQDPGNKKPPDSSNIGLPDPTLHEDDKTDPNLVVSETSSIPKPQAPPSTNLTQSLQSPRSQGASQNSQISQNQLTPSAPSPSPNLTPTPPNPTPNRPPIRMPDLGPVSAFMKDPNISEIMINDIRNIVIERQGRLEQVEQTFQNMDELNRITRNILDITGRIISPESPYVDVSLPDGSRVNIVAPPLTLAGPCITIRKFPSQRYSMKQLVGTGLLNQKMAYFLNACVLGRLNILVCGGTGSGKTTFLNSLIPFIPKDERIVSIEDTPELFIQHVNSVRLQTKFQTPTSAAVTARELVANALRMRPDRIIVGECRRGEAFDMLQAMNTGHSGSMTTIHSNSPRDGLTRLETLCMLSGIEIPLLAIRKQIASAIDLVIQIKRFRTGHRKIVEIAELVGMEGEIITTQDLFIYEPNLNDPTGAQPGIQKSTGYIPTFIDRLKEQGIEIPMQVFE